MWHAVNFLNEYKYSSWWTQVIFIYKRIMLVLKGVQEQLGIGFLEKTCVDKHVGYMFIFFMDKS
jgi:hypothetical protein